jgi:hypothetical protein
MRHQSCRRNPRPPTPGLVDAGRATPPRRSSPPFVDFPDCSPARPCSGHSGRRSRGSWRPRPGTDGELYGVAKIYRTGNGGIPALRGVASRSIRASWSSWSARRQDQDHELGRRHPAGTCRPQRRFQWAGSEYVLCLKLVMTADRAQSSQGRGWRHRPLARRLTKEAGGRIILVAVRGP